MLLCVIFIIIYGAFRFIIFWVGQPISFDSPWQNQTCASFELFELRKSHFYYFASEARRSNKF